MNPSSFWEDFYAGSSSILRLITVATPVSCSSRQLENLLTPGGLLHFLVAQDSEMHKLHTGATQA